MSNFEIILLFIGMLVVTYIPRAIPSVLVGKVRYGKNVEKFLKLIPYTAMAALIFPGVITIDGNPVIGIIGGAVAAVLAWFKCPVMVCVLAAIGADFVLYMIL